MMSHSTHADDLIILRTYGYRHEAELALSALKAHSIHAVISSDDYGGMSPMLGASTGGVRLMVRRSDEDKAVKVLS